MAVRDTPLHALEFPFLVTTFWTWASIVGLSMTPNLVLGSQAAIGVGMAAHFSPWVLLPVVAVASYVEGLIVAWLAGQSTRIGFISRWVARLRTPRALEFADRWGVWGGLTLGCAFVGQEPVLVALRWLDVGMGRIWLPLAVSNALFTLLFYAVMWSGLSIATFASAGMGRL